MIVLKLHSNLFVSHYFCQSNTDQVIVSIAGTRSTMSLWPFAWKFKGAVSVVVMGLGDFKCRSTLDVSF